MFTKMFALTKNILKKLPSTSTAASAAAVRVYHRSIMSPIEVKPPLPPFTKETALQKIRMAEDAWNSQDPDKVKMAYTEDSVWRNRDTFLQGRDEIRNFLSGKWDREQEYRLIKELWSFTDNRIAVRFCYEYHDAHGQWYVLCRFLSFCFRYKK